MIDLSIHRKF